jgi:hypothetical protein
MSGMSIGASAARFDLGLLLLQLAHPYYVFIN